MKAEIQSKTEKAIAFIAQRGSARSPEIAEHIKINATAIQAFLAGPLEAGYLIACKVEIPGKRPMNEYRLSANVSESKQSWADFKAASRLSTKPLKIAKDRPPRVPPETKPRTVAPEMPKRVIPAELPTPKPGEAIKAATTGERKRLIFMIDSNGQLRIEWPEETVILSNEETRDVGELMAAAEPIWS